MSSTWSSLSTEEFQKHLRFSSLPYKYCHFFGSRPSLFILRDGKAQITVLQYFLHGWVTNLMFTKCRMVLWQNRAWEWGSSYSNAGCAPGFCVNPWASSLTSLILNLFSRKLGGKWCSLSHKGVRRVPSGTFRWNWVLQKSKPHFYLLTIRGDGIRGLTTCQGRCMKNSVQDLPKCSTLTIKAFIHSWIPSRRRFL